MNKIFNFIITDAGNPTFTLDFYRHFKPLYLGANGFTLLIHNIDTFKELVHEANDDFKFRVLIHAEIRNHTSNIEQAEGLKVLKSLKRDFPSGKFLLISGEENILPNQGNLKYEFAEVAGARIYNKADLTNPDFFEVIDGDFVNFKKDFWEVESKDIVSISKSDNSAQPLSIEVESQTINTVATDHPSFTILTALTKDEYSSFRENVYKEKEERGILTGKFKKVEKYTHDFPYDIQFIRQKNMGMVDAALSTANILHQHNTDILIMSGVCGGRESETKLYDIIIPRNIIDIITGKYEKEVFIPYGYSEVINENLIEFLSESERIDAIKDRMFSLVPNTTENKRKNAIINDLSFKFDSLACGSFVLKTNNFLEKKAQEVNNKIVGFEMESYGVMRATNFFNYPHKLSLIVKSVMDFTNEKKVDEINGEPIKNLAAYMSYLCVRVLIPYVSEFYITEFKK